MAFAAAGGQTPQLASLPRPPTLAGMVGVAAMVQHAVTRRAAADLAAMEAAAAAAVQRAAEALEAIPEPADGVHILPGPSMAKMVFEGLSGGAVTGGVERAVTLMDRWLRRYGPVIEMQLGSKKVVLSVDPTLGDQMQGAKGHRGMDRDQGFYRVPEQVGWEAGQHWCCRAPRNAA